MSPLNETGKIPARLKRWILIWTPLLWLGLALITYPEDTGANDGVVGIIKGFFAPEVGAYVPYLIFALAYIALVPGIGLLLPESVKLKPLRILAPGLVLVGLVCVILLFLKGLADNVGFFDIGTWLQPLADAVEGVVGLVFWAIVPGLILMPLVVPTRRVKTALPFVLLALGADFVVWGLLACGLLGGEEGFSWTVNQTDWGWAFQTAAVLLVAACVWVWGSTNSERAELTVWNARQVWKLYRANWQGMLGLYIMLFFLLMALLAPFIADHAKLEPTAQVGLPFEAPSWSYYKIFGTDEQGLSIWAEFIWSARISLVVGIMATIISSLIGAAIGIAAGFYGGATQEVLMRLTDAFLVIPWLPLAMVLAAAWGRNYGIIMLIIGVTSWPGTARVVRSDALRVRELQFIERGRAIGSSGWHIMNRHILPNVFPLIAANTVLVVAIAILSETELSFLGLGDPLNFSWGTMLHYAWGAGAAGLPAWWYIGPPGLAIVLIVLAFTFIGTAFDEVLDPKLRKREDSGGGRPDEGRKPSGEIQLPSGPVGDSHRGTTKGELTEGGLL